MELISLMCERARRWASLSADAELSQLESRLLAAHLEGCAGCRRFAVDLGGIAAALRAAPLEPSAGVRLPARVRTPRAGIAVVVAVASLLLVVLAAGAATLGGRSGDVRATKPIAMVSGVESPNELRRLRRERLIHYKPAATVPRNRLVANESF
jgi:predicted anti-sigma-YlaC factor YlaD